MEIDYSEKLFKIKQLIHKKQKLISKIRKTNVNELDKFIYYNDEIVNINSKIDELLEDEENEN